MEENELQELDPFHRPPPDEQETSFINDDQFIDDSELIHTPSPISDLIQKFNRLGNAPSPSIVNREFNLVKKASNLRNLFDNSEWRVTDEG